MVVIISYITSHKDLRHPVLLAEDKIAASSLLPRYRRQLEIELRELYQLRTGNVLRTKEVQLLEKVGQLCKELFLSSSKVHNDLSRLCNEIRAIAKY